MINCCGVLLTGWVDSHDDSLEDSGLPRNILGFLMQLLGKTQGAVTIEVRLNAPMKLWVIPLQ